MKKNIIIGMLLFISVIAIGLCIFLMSSENVDNKTAPTIIPNKPTNTPSAFLPIIRYHYSPGDLLVFKTKYQSHAQIQKKQITQDMVDMIIEGKLQQRIYEVKGQNIFAGFTLNPSMVTITAADKSFIQQMFKVLQTEVFVSFNTQGIIERWFFPEEIPADLRNTMKSLLLNIQVIFGNEEKSEWTHKENDMNGTYLANYKAAKAAKTGQIFLFKQKLEYVKDEENERPAKILMARGTIKLDPKGNHIQTLSWKEDVEQHAMEFINKGQVEISLQLENKTNEATLVQGMNEKLKKGNFYITASHKIEGEAEMRKRRLERIVGKKTWADLQNDMANLRKTLTPDKSESKERNEFYRQLGAWLELHPENISDIVKDLLNVTKLDPTTGAILSALTDVKDPAAQAALAEVIQKRMDNPNLVAMAVSCLTLLTDPNEASIQLVQNLHRTSQDEQIKGAATLALGGMIGEIRKKDPSQATALIYDMEKNLQSASNFNQKKLYLEALGNAGSSSSLTYINQCLQDSDDVIRSTAAASLRFIDDPQADIILAQGLQNNTGFNIKNSILDSLSYRKPSQVVFNSLQENLRVEDSENLRVKNLRLLWQMRKQFPQAEGIVKQSGISDKSAKVRQMVQSMILVDRE